MTPSAVWSMLVFYAATLSVRGVTAAEAPAAVRSSPAQALSHCYWLALAALRRFAGVFADGPAGVMTPAALATATHDLARVQGVLLALGVFSPAELEAHARAVVDGSRSLTLLSGTPDQPCRATFDTTPPA